MDYTYAGHYEDIFVDPAGNGLPGAEVIVRTPTGALATLYSGRDKAGTVDNPTVTDSVGNCEFFADPGVYSLEVRVGGRTRYRDDHITVPIDPAELQRHEDDEGLHGVGAAHPDLSAHVGLGLATAADLEAHKLTPHGESDVQEHVEADDPHGSNDYTDNAIAAATSTLGDNLSEHVGELGAHGAPVVLIEGDGGLADVMPRPEGVPFVWYRLKTNPAGVLDNEPGDAIDNVTGVAW